MKTNILRTLIFAAPLAAALLCSTTLVAQTQNPVTNRDVIRMVKNALPESVILSTIQAGPTNFDTSVDGLISLHRAGVSKKVMDAMMAAAANRQPQVAGPPAPSAVPPVTPGLVAVASAQTSQGPSVTGVGAFPGVGSTIRGAPMTTTGGTPAAALAAVAPAAPVPDQPTVYLFLGASAPGTTASQAAVNIGGERTQLIETKAKPTSMSSLALDSALQAGVNTTATEVMMHTGSPGAGISLGQAAPIFSGILGHRQPSVTYVWALQGLNSANSLATGIPRFGIDYGKVPGINPDDFEPAIVKLTPSQNMWRLVGATQGKQDARSNSVPNWQVYTAFLEDRVTATSRKLAPGQYEISPASALLAGEYAIVFRPVSKMKKFSGGDVARNQGDGMMFNSAWSFQVPAGAPAR